ncbi:hypothetical protein CEE39_05260 [bacterium (candidate division B38) B3_B38]|nr:MAG: hypothetical protein CEE39_05260 [bacterium (candidate division B38) B3_B38]
MNRTHSLKVMCALLLCLVIFLVSPAVMAQQKKALTFQDVMKFKAIMEAVVSENGSWIAYTAQPDRGDGKVNIHSTTEEKVFTIKRGSKPVFSKHSHWVAVVIKPKAIELEKAKKEKHKEGMALLETATGEVSHFEKVERFAFSDDSKWLAYHHFKEEEKPAKEEKMQSSQQPAASAEPKEDKKKKEIGSTLVLRHLASGQEISIPYVLSFAFDKSSRYLAYAIADPEGKDNGLFCRELQKEAFPQITITKTESSRYSNLTWSKKKSKLAFLSAVEDEEGQAGPATLWVWDGETGESNQAVQAEGAPEGWMLPLKNQVSWTRDGKRIFFGFKPKAPQDAGLKEEKEQEEKEEVALYNIEDILKKREVDVWHWNDPRIVTHQKKLWSRFKDRTYRAVYHLDSGQAVALADQEMPVVELTENPHFALGLSDVPYLKEITWEGRFNDVYLVNLEDGSRKKVVSRLQSRASLSPNGSYIVYYNDLNWHIYDSKTGTTRNLTSQLDIPFFNEDHDYPSNPPGYGVAGWVEDDRAVLIYDKYDIWQFPTCSGEPINLTGGEGRQSQVTFRVLRLDPEKRFFGKDQQLLLSAYHNLKKHTGFYTCQEGTPGVERLIEEKKRFRFLAKAKKKQVLMYTRESYSEFPDIWVSDMDFDSPRKISDVNPQISEFAWGSAELVEWKSLDGIPLQGVLIKPGNYQPGKRYPVLVYFYRFFSQRLYEFNQPMVNHRPCFPLYASNGYAIFLPDIRFEVGRPGFAATKCLVPGVQKLIDMGIADAEAIGLHGHSWSGYQTAFVITQTNIFAAAIAGAPVSNMTSAYSGIRWESGMARQFQYERTQSRIGGSLWEYPERYIENSPVFFADRINTPLLIEFGDEDGAVPWYQGIELYLAMRRLGKDCIFLQYRGEPHHLKKYPNKLDYAIKMKQYFDHYLKGELAPEWITQGVPYRGH